MDSSIGIIGAGIAAAAFARRARDSGLDGPVLVLDAEPDRPRFASMIDAISDDPTDLSGVALIVLAAGALDEEPAAAALDLYRRLLPPALAAAPDAVLLVAAHPNEASTGAILELTGLNAARVLGTGTVVDSMLLRHRLAARLAVHESDVHVHVVGEHGLAALPLWSSAHVAGAPLPSFRPRDKRPITVPERSRLLQAAREGAAAATTTAHLDDLADATARIARAVILDEQRVLTVCSRLQTLGDLDMSGVCLAAPAIVGRSGIVRIIDEVPLNPAESAGLEQAARRVREATRAMAP